MKVGFLHGRGDLGETSRLDLELVDQTYVPAKGETVVTWGSQDGAPYALRRAGGHGRVGLLQPARDHPARRDRAVRGLLGPRPRGEVVVPSGTRE
jgi:rod shape-determining protein MreC